jgi:hypothetical protein
VQFFLVCCDKGALLQAHIEANMVQGFDLTYNSFAKWNRGGLAVLAPHAVGGPVIFLTGKWSEFVCCEASATIAIFCGSILTRCSHIHQR